MHISSLSGAGTMHRPSPVGPSVPPWPPSAAAVAMPGAAVPPSSIYAATAIAGALHRPRNVLPASPPVPTSAAAAVADMLHRPPPASTPAPLVPPFAAAVAVLTRAPPSSPRRW